MSLSIEEISEFLRSNRDQGGLGIYALSDGEIAIVQVAILSPDQARAQAVNIYRMVTTEVRE